MFSAFPLSLFALASTLWLYRRWIRTNLPLPPGPRPLPIIGNLLDMPTGFDWETYHRWAKNFGQYFSQVCPIHDRVSDSDIIYVNAAGTSIVVLNSYDAAIELLEKRSNIYSSRFVDSLFDPSLTSAEFECRC